MGKVRHRFWLSLFFLVFIAVGLNAYKDYGVSWDEPISRNNGMVSLKYAGEILAPGFIAGDPVFKKYPPLSDYVDKDYGVAFELPLVLLERVFKLNVARDIYHFRHLMTFLVFFAGIFAVFKLAERRFEDWRFGIVAALFVILNPRLFAESFYNDKDLVFMAMFAISMNTAVVFLQKPAFRNACWHALATAILVDIRIMGIIVPVFTVVFVLWGAFRGEVKKNTVYKFLPVYLSLSVILTVIFWPYLWSDPWNNFIDAFINMSKFRWGYSVLFTGNWIDATELPWYYIPVWIGITTPVFYLLFFFIGVFFILRQIAVRHWHLWAGEAEWQDVLFLGFFVSPLLAVILFDSVVYDGWRQLYFIYPAFVMVAMRGWNALMLQQSGGRANLIPAIVLLASLVFFISTSFWMIKFHPFQNNYFNLFAGSNVKTKFDVDYWGLSSRQALQYVADQDRRLKITVWAGSFVPLENGKILLMPEDSKRLFIVRQRADADYIITQYRRNLTDYSKVGLPFKKFYQIDVDNEAIITVFKRQPG